MWTRCGALWRGKPGGKAALTGYVDLGVLGRRRIMVYANEDENRAERAPEYYIVLPPEEEARG